MPDAGKKRERITCLREILAKFCTPAAWPGLGLFCPITDQPKKVFLAPAAKVSARNGAGRG